MNECIPTISYQRKYPGIVYNGMDITQEIGSTHKIVYLIGYKLYHLKLGLLRSPIKARHLLQVCDNLNINVLKK